MSASDGKGSVRVFVEYEEAIHEKAEVVVVGSGPSGAVVAYELAKAGKDVVLLEEGPPITPRDYVLEGSFSLSRTMREGGLRTTRGNIMPTMQANCLGGASLVNSAICVRAPAFVLDRWCEEYQLEQSTRSDLDPHYDAVAEFLGIAPTPENVLGKRSLLFRDACDRLGYSHEPISRNVRGCRGSGECMTGCRNRAKQSMDISYIPAAIRLGARVFTSLQAQRIRWKRRCATGVEGRVVEPYTGKLSHRFRIDADIVVLAAGCMATPVLLRKSGRLANGSGQVGRNLLFHPGSAITGIFPDPIDPQFGATQGYQSLHFLREGFKLETFWGPPGATAVRVPGYGLELLQRLGELDRAATWDAIVSANRSPGTVQARRLGMDPVIRWRFHPEDLRMLVHALWVLAEMFFTAGATKIIPGVQGLPDEIRSLDEARLLRSEPIGANDVVCVGNHAFCSTRMHGDSKRGVVDEIGRCHDLDNLFIADTGIFPKCPSVNPMFTGMALARRQAHFISSM